MRRRNFIFGLMAVVTTGGARAAERKSSHRIAIVVSAGPVTGITESGDAFWQSLFDELRRSGYVEGQNLLIDRYSGDGRADYLDLVRDVLRRNPELIIVIGSNFLTLDFKAAPATVPIVATLASPVEMGIVASLARPGDNITGAAVDVGLEQWGKRIQLLQQMMPQATRFGFLQTRAARGQWVPRLQYSGVTWVGPPLDPPIDEAAYRRVFTGLAQDRAEGIVVAEEADNIVNLKLVVELAEKNRLPAVYPMKMFVEAGGLMSYGLDTLPYGRRLADIAGQILKGAKPSETPIVQPTKFELAINLKTAKALGLTVPPELLATADEVIE
jgi:putative tryptophan/tyrosine transport system substrate-binding protein